MKTEKLYTQDVYLTEAEARVEQITESKKGLEVVLDRTVFFPEGGGQPCDLGEISAAAEGRAVPLSYVSEKDEVVFHRIDPSYFGDGTVVSAEQLPFAEGDTVRLKLDFDRRFENMQRHAGEHLLSGVFADIYGGANKGFHMGEEYITIDILLPDPADTDAADPATGKAPEKVSWDMAMVCEEAANKAIWRDLPITVKYFDDAEEASKMPLRKPLTDTIASGEAGDVISIVTIGDESDPVDCVACCGTHPSTTGQIGLVKIFKVEKNKEYWRIFFDAGARAMRDYREKHDVLTRVSDRYSAGISDFDEKLRAEEKKNSEVRARLGLFLQKILRVRADEILEKIAAAPDEVIFDSFDDMTCDDLIKMAKMFSGEAKKPVLLYSEPDGTLMLFSDGSVHCGKLVRENAHIYNGKGGGSDTLARAIFPRKDDVPVFAELVRAHLR